MEQLKVSVSLLLLLVLIAMIAGCAGPVLAPATSPTPVPDSTSAPIPTLTPVTPPGSTPSGTQTPTSPMPTAKFIFNDDFSNPKSGWPTQTSQADKYECGYQTEGQQSWYYVQLKQSQYGVNLQNQVIGEFSDFVVQVDGMLSTEQADGTYGLNLRVSPDGLNRYVFAISTAGKYTLEKWTNGQSNVLVNWTDSPYIKKGSNQVNRLMLECRGPEIKAFVNGQLLVTVTDSTHTKGLIGFIARPSGQANALYHFDNFSISSDIPPPILTPTQPALKPTPTPTPKPPPTPEYPAPSVYYRMDNTHEVAVRPDGKELYVYGVGSSIILVVDLDSPDYPVTGEITLPGRVAAPVPYISFSSDSRFAYITRALQSDYEESGTAFSDYTKIIVIDTAKKQIKSAIPMPAPVAPTASVIPSADGRWLYFTAGYPPGQPLGIGKLDPDSQKIVSFLPLSEVNFITSSGDGKYIYATQGWNISGPPDNQLSVIDAETMRVVSSVAVGDGPQYVAVTPDGKKAYVSNKWSGNISVVNLETMKVTATIDIGTEPRVIAITPDGKKAYVALTGVSSGMTTYQFGNTVAVIDVQKDVVLSNIKVHVEPESIAIDPDGTRAYVSDGNANGLNPAEIHVIDTVKDTYLRPIILRKAAKYTPTNIGITPDGQKLFVTCEAAGSLLAIDADSGGTLGKLDIQPRAVKVSRDGTLVYVFSPQKLYLIRTGSLEVAKSIDLSKVYPAPKRADQEAFRIVLNRTEDTAYLLGISNEVVVVSLAKGEVVARIPFTEQPINIARGLVLPPDESKLLVSDYHSRTVVVIDASTGTIIAKIPVANAPSEIKISQDGKRAYVLQQHSTTLMTIINLDTNAVLNSIEFRAGVHGQLDFEMSPDERYVYIACFDLNFVMVYDLQQRKMVKIIDTGLDPFNTVSSPDKKLIYVTNFTTDDISVVDTTTHSLVKTIKLSSN